MAEVSQEQICSRGAEDDLSISTQTEISNISDMDCLLATDMRGLFNGNESASISDDAGCTSDCSTSSSDLVTPEGASFKFPAKGRASKPKIFEQNSQTKLDNRFKCFEENNPENGDTLGETVRESPPNGFGRNRLREDKSHKRTTSSKVKSPPECSYEAQLRQLKASIDTSNKLPPEIVPLDMPTMSSSGISGVGGSPPPPPIPPVAAVVSAPEITST
ncbi:MAG: hypothetical protein GY696_31220, partial [Gammaproteobacteria bacterium]|nr:hypothetical protein [Gammaproteobacteria bacterium]